MKTIRNLMFGVFLCAALLALQTNVFAWDDPSFTNENYCSKSLTRAGWGDGPAVSGSLTNCQFEVSEDFCSIWLYEVEGYCLYTLGPQMDSYFGYPPGCYITFPGGFACDQEEGWAQMSWDCSIWNWCVDRVPLDLGTGA